MSSFKIVVISSIIFFMLSCGSDSGENIVGDWELSEFSINCASDESENASFQASNGCVTLFDETLCITMRFFENGTGQVTQFDGDSETDLFTYMLDDTNNQLRLCQDGDCFNGQLINGELRFVSKEEDCDVTQVLSRR